MCLGIPGRIVEITDAANYLAKVDVNGVQRTISVRLLDDDIPQLDDWVLVHVGFAMAKIDETEALLTLAAVKKTGRRLHQRNRSLRLVGHCLKGGDAMKFVDEFRDPAAARSCWLPSITWPARGDEHFKFMEVCGGHTHTIYRHGIEHLLPDNVELVHGPGCPVCVIPMGRVDDAMWLAEPARRDLHLLRRHDAGARVERQPAGGQGPRRRRAVRLLAAGRAQDRASTTPTSTWCSSPSDSRPPRRRPR